MDIGPAETKIALATCAETLERLIDSASQFISVIRQWISIFSAEAAKSVNQSSVGSCGSSIGGTWRPVLVDTSSTKDVVPLSTEYHANNGVKDRSSLSDEKAPQQAKTQFDTLN